jgi:hypothetical protein
VASSQAPIATTTSTPTTDNPAMREYERFGATSAP